VSLLCSILASVSYFWTPQDCRPNLFATMTEANEQAPFWVKTTLDLLNHVHGSGSPSVETLQAMIIVSFVVCNLGGVTPRYRSLISTALTMARELGLHRLDQSGLETSSSKGGNVDVVETEVGRRVWWYLVATDW
jgi:hypothetical protein